MSNKLVVGNIDTLKNEKILPKIVIGGAVNENTEDVYNVVPGMPVDGGFFEDLYIALQQGLDAGFSVNEAFDVYKQGANISDEDLQAYIDAVARMDKSKMTNEQYRFQKAVEKNGGGFFGGMKALYENPGYLPQLIVTSGATMFGSLIDSEEVAGFTALGAGAGAGTGAAVGSTGFTLGPVGAFTTAGGAITGAVGGAFTGLTGAMETSLTLTDLLRDELGNKEFNKENIRAILENPEAVERLKNRSLARGMTIGMIEGLTVGLSRGAASGVVRGVKRAGTTADAVKTALKTSGKTAAVEMAGGGTGELLGQIAAGQEIKGEEIFLEAIAEGKGIVNVSDIISSAAKPTMYKLNGEFASKKEIESVLNDKNLTPEELLNIKIEIENDVNLQEKLIGARARANIKKDIDKNVTNESDLNELIDLEIERRSLESNKKNKKGVFRPLNLDNNIETNQNKIDEILSKYEGVTTEQVTDVTEKAIVLERLKADVNFAEKYAGLFDLKFNQINDEAALEKYLKDNNIKGKIAEDFRKSSGFVNEGELVINMPKAAEVKNVNIGNHELLHGILRKAVREGKINETLIQDLEAKIGSKNWSKVEQKIKDGNYSESYMKANPDEYITLLSEAILEQKVKLDRSMLQKLADLFTPILRRFGFKKINFENADATLDFLKEYHKNIKAGKLSKAIISATASTGKTGVKMSRSKAVDAVNEIEQGLIKKLNEQGKEYTQDEFRTSEQFNELFDSITESGGAVNNYIKSLGMSKEKTKETIEKVSRRLMNYNPQAERKTGSKEAVTIGERIMSDTQFAKLDAARDLAIEAKREGKTKRIDAAKRTKEGETTFDIEDTGIDATMEALETEDMSPQAIAKREAQENKKKKARKSKLRKDVGIEDGSEIYNKVLSSAKQSLILAYRKTRGIKNKLERAAAIVKIIADEYAGEKGLTSGRYTELFKLVKNSLGTKEYLNYLKKHRVSIVESMFTADLVQMERNVPDSERIFTKFVKRLTSKQEVQDAVNKGLLPKDALNTIDKGQAVNLYEKIMPTEDEIVGFADQPAINPKTGKRSGLKGTRKDSFAKYTSKAFIFDALMEVRQEPDVDNLVTNEFNAQLDVIELSATIGRDVNLKFSKSTAVADIDAAIDISENTDVYLQIKFSKSHRDQYEARLEKKRPDLTEDQRKNAVQSVFDFVDGKDIPNNKKAKYEKMAMHYMANGYLILPEDGYKVIEAERVAGIKKIDPFSYKNPNVLIEENVVKKKVKRTNPDDVKTFTNKTEYSDGVVVYDVENSKQGQLDVRKVIDTHFGKKANPWCLCARQAPGAYIETDESYSLEGAEQIAKTHQDLGRRTNIETYTNPDGTKVWEIYVYEKGQTATELDNAFGMWKNYNQSGNGFKIAFHNGNLVSFRDGNNMQWWDRMDKPSEAVIVKGKKVGDGFREVIQVDENKSTVIHTEKQVGDSKTGTYTKKNLDGDVVEITSTKNGYKDGKQFEVIDKVYYNAEFTTIYKNGDAIRKEEVRTPYKEFKGKGKSETIGVGSDQLRLENITKYKRVIIKQNPGESYVELEGTVSQSMFEQAKNPDSITDPFVKKNFKYLVQSNERYFPLQGKKVSVIKKSKPQSFLPDGEVTIDGELQTEKVKFSRSANNEVNYNLKNSSVKFSNTSVKQRDKAIQKLGIEIGKFEEDTSQKFLYETLLFNLSKEDISYEEAVNITVNAVNEKYGGQVAFEIKNILSEGILTKENVNSVVDGFKNITLEELRIESLPLLAKAYNKIFTDPGITIDQKINVLLNFVGIVGRSTRSGKNTPLRTNKMLFDWIENNFVLPKEIKDKLTVEIFDGYGKENISKILYNGKEINKYLHTDTIRRKLTSNKNVQEILDIMKSQAQEAFSTMIDILGKNSKFTLEEKLAFIERTFLDQMGMMRKTYPPGFYVYGDKYNEKNTKLEHNPPVAEAKEIWKQYAKGIIGEQKVLSWYENSNASVNVISTEMNDALTKAGLSQSRKGLDNRMEHKSVKPLVDKAVKNNEVGNYTDIKQDYALKTYEKTKSAFRFSRSTNNPTKGITILDFDDTLATSSSLIRYTRPDGTKGTLTPEQYASTYEDLLGLGYEFDFSEFNKVVDGKPAPLLNKAKKLAGKFGTKNMFILTARPAASAPAIQKFLKENGLDIPLKNITGLGNSTAEAKAMWVLDKVSEGYNDFYFADDAIQNVKEVKNVLEQVDVKSKVQQARVKFSKSLDKDFNDIIQDVKGIDSDKRFSVAKGRARGKGKGRFRFFIPPSHEDFVGLLYNFIGFGEKGNKHRDFFEKSLIKPLNRGFRELNVAKQAIANDYRNLVKSMPQVRKRLGEKILKGDYTVEDAIRVYLFNKAGYEIPGLTKTDLKNLTDFVKQNSDILQFAEQVGKISRVEEGYISPGDSWQASNIRYDLVDATGRVGRAKFFTEFQENADIIFSDENINKIRAAFGDNFVEALQDMLYRIKTGSNRPTGNNRIVNRFLDWINGSVGATMFFNARSAVLQTLSTVNFINFGDNNIFKAAAAFANQKQYWSDFAALFNSDFLKQRRSGAAFDVNANEIAREVAGSKNPVLAAIKYLLNIGFLPTQLADSFAIASGGATFYRNRIKTYLKQGLSQKEAEAKAFIDFQEIAEATQQSARPDMVSQQQTSTLGRIILAFQNVTAQYARLIKKATLDLVKRRRSRGYQTQIQSDMSNISRIIYYGAIQAVIFNALQNALFAMMFDEDEEDEKKTEKFFKTKKQRVINGTIDSLLKGLGVGGAVVATLKNYVIKLSENLQDDSFFKEPPSMELLQLSPPIGIKIRKIRRAEKNLEWNKDVLTELPLDNLDNPIYETSANYIEGLFNIPVARLLRKVQNINAALDSQNKWWQRVAIGLGWSRWDVGITDNEIKEAKKAIRENNKRIEKETKLKKATPEEKIKIVEKSVFDLNKAEQVKILEANNLDPKKYKKEADRVEAIMKLREKNERKIDSTITAVENYIPTEEEQRSIDLFKMNKKDQVNMLIDLGLSSKQIKELKYEEDRVNKIIELQDKKKSKKR